MNMILFLVILAAITGVVSFVAAYQWRWRSAPVNWLFLLAFGFGSLSIMLMYGDIYYITMVGGSKSPLLSYLRLIISFVLVVTLSLSASVLVRRNKD